MVISGRRHPEGRGELREVRAGPGFIGALGAVTTEDRRRVPTAAQPVFHFAIYCRQLL